MWRNGPRSCATLVPSQIELELLPICGWGRGAGAKPRQPEGKSTEGPLPIAGVRIVEPCRCVTPVRREVIETPRSGVSHTDHYQTTVRPLSGVGMTILLCTRLDAGDDPVRYTAKECRNQNSKTTGRNVCGRAVGSNVITAMRCIGELGLVRQVSGLWRHVFGRPEWADSQSRRLTACGSAGYRIY